MCNINQENLLDNIILNTVLKEMWKWYILLLDYAKAFDRVDHNKLWKILKEKGIPSHLTCLLRNLYAVQEATVTTGHGTDWFQKEKEYFNIVYCHSAYLTYMMSTSWETLG